ncbi:MAG: GNAT family N-acetyltransferase [Thermoleophilia bacterium]|nr:GNAT family N-acetyltransferase [Thermoleophilia bacterium]
MNAREVPELAAVLARAFHEDPQAMWLVPNDSRRARTLERGFDLFLRRRWFPEGECYTTEAGLGIAIWEPPGTEQPSTLQQLRLLPSMALAYGRYLPRLMGVISVQESNHPRKAHYYLAFVGVEPECQNRGIGAGLMRPILDRVDREGVPAYLEATSPRSRRLYERLGFEVTEEFHLGKGAPPAWRMWREGAV